MVVVSMCIPSHLIHTSLEMTSVSVDKDVMVIYTMCAVYSDCRRRGWQ